MTSVVVFDYGFGNVRSMVRALANLDLDVTLTSDHRQALEADGLVVPGVGAFGACMEGLKSVGGDRVIKDRLRAGRPVLLTSTAPFVEDLLLGITDVQGVRDSGVETVDSASLTRDDAMKILAEHTRFGRGSSSIE